jgi:TonB dependent receptor-like, beta-barrel/Carboxypeptidase regulatory-like domain
VRKTLWSFAALGSVALLLGLPASVALAQDSQAGSVMGWVEDSRGLPVSGALVSFFAKGMTGGGLVAFSDDAGRFTLPALPAGSYTVRAVGRGLRAAQAQRVTVLPNQDAILSLSLAGLTELTEKESAEKSREWTWLIRHKVRSVLEDSGVEVTPARSVSADFDEDNAAWLPEIGGSVEVMTNGLSTPGGDFSASDLLSGTGALRLEGRIADIATFSLGGLVAESEDTTWRMGAEFIVEPGSGHEVRAGAGYGTRYVRPLSAAEAEVRLDSGTVGALFIEDRWTLSKRVTATFGARHSYVGFVNGDRNHVDPSAAFEFNASDGTTLLASAEERTIIPGGDLLTLSTLSVAPAIVYADLGGTLAPEHLVRYRLGLERHVGDGRVGIRAFREQASDQLMNAFSGPRAARSLRIDNRGALATQGVTVDVSHGIGRFMRGSVAYSYGHLEHAVRPGYLTLEDAPLTPGEGRFHDLTAQVETVIEPTDTRVVAYYRVNFIRATGPGAPERSARRNTRFDVQLSQGLPFLGELTRADWDLLVAVRNLFYETSEGGMLDEMAVLNAPTRVMGGISVRF